MKQILDKQLSDSLYEFSKVAQRINDLKKEKKELKDELLKMPPYNSVGDLISAYEETVSEETARINQDIKDAELERDMKKEYILAEISENYESPFSADIPMVGKISAKWEDVDTFEEVSCDKLEVVRYLLDNGLLDCIHIDKEKYLEQAEKCKALGMDAPPGIFTIQTDKIIIKPARG